MNSQQKTDVILSAMKRADKLTDEEAATIIQKWFRNHRRKKSDKIDKNF